ncbi:metallopeptidase TldD-related protein [Actinomadura madurae]|uniref:metallopeptidase TldD-related protein n=1 Tax=Actinomadura madurae TaxID=1993 RepID=UPI0020D2355E|nr:metallopeptidase TldD-related protein [Actinomadura madurae]MCP9964628.1 metallopeptidase TldD-related protein [Actinomadura madurae]MCP9977102.1 metallopeptidase TldD-related protein [Actinomadura madurae]
MRPQEAVERALSLSRADDCVVIADEASTANLRWAGNTLTTNGVTRSSRLTVIALRRTADGVAAGVVSRSAVGADGIEDLVRAAEADAAGNEPAEDARPLVTEGRGGAAWDADPAETGIGVFEGFAPALGEAFAAAQAGDRRLYGFANHVLTSSFLGTSAGLRLRHDQPSGLLELNAKGAGGSAWAGVGTRDFTDVDVPALTGDLARRLQWGERRVDLPAGRYETVLPPSAVADLMIYLYWSAGAQDAHDGRTVFSAPGGGTRVGEKIANLPVTLSSDPAAPGMECAPFVIAHASGRESSVFDNGLPLHATDWIGDGTLKALAQTRHSAERTGLPVTPAVDNLAMRGPDGGASLEEMVARTERGLLLTCLWYIREVDPQSLLLTGLTRDGVYLVEDGEVVGAVNNFRFNESPVDLLSRLAEVGATVPTLPREWSDYFTRAAMPPVRVGDFNMSTVSQAS